jgi:hypothetical protein
MWDAEWGKIGTEGNLFWLGSIRNNWEAVMGKQVPWWFRKRMIRVQPKEIFAD